MYSDCCDPVVTTISSVVKPTSASVRSVPSTTVGSIRWWYCWPRRRCSDRDLRPHRRRLGHPGEVRPPVVMEQFRTSPLVKKKIFVTVVVIVAPDRAH